MSSIGDRWLSSGEGCFSPMRDDISGMQLSGSKVRKMEFLMADGVAQGANSIITMGAIQSNHCRATTVAAKYLNLDSYVILRISKVLVDEDPGLIGNLLVQRWLVHMLTSFQKKRMQNMGLCSEEEIKFVKEVAAETGVILDPVYRMLKDMNDNPAKWEGRKVLFIHTGGLLGLFNKVDQLAPMVGNWRRMDIAESSSRMDSPIIVPYVTPLKHGLHREESKTPKFLAQELKILG
ncbi:hypothetical protein Syun_022496 [Stephania yunnanensis]|uniref:Tryptophan synthase beta chain-like PALP domain-containing protein n=1 Tax=Stephania yunnanensis TaxID=152371 RepID=A0AAP0I2W6_9MAGN